MNAGRAGLFLDLDGTLADSVPALRRAYDATLASFGAQGSDEEFEACNGLPLAQVIEHLRAAHGIAAEPTEVLQRFGRESLEAYVGSPPRRGARALLAAAGERGMPVAVVTSSVTGFVRHWLSRHGLAASVSAIVGSDSVARGKPAPDPYQHALSRTGCDPSLSLAVEDTRTGAESAVAAKLPTLLIGRRPSVPADWPRLRGVISSLDEAISLLDA